MLLPAVNLYVQCLKGQPDMLSRHSFSSQTSPETHAIPQSEVLRLYKVLARYEMVSLCELPLRVV